MSKPESLHYCVERNQLIELSNQEQPHCIAVQAGSNQSNLTNTTATHWEMNARSFSTPLLNFLISLPYSDTQYWGEILRMDQKMEAYRNKLMAELGPVFRPSDSQAKIFSSPLQLCYIDSWQRRNKIAGRRMWAIVSAATK